MQCNATHLLHASGRENLSSFPLGSLSLARGATRDSHWKRKARKGKAPGGRGGGGTGLERSTGPSRSVVVSLSGPRLHHRTEPSEEEGKAEKKKEKAKGGWLAGVGDGPASSTPRIHGRSLLGVPTAPSCPAAIRHELARGHRIFSSRRTHARTHARRRMEFRDLTNTHRRVNVISLFFSLFSPQAYIVVVVLVVCINQMLDNARRDSSYLRVAVSHRICDPLIPSSIVHA